VTTKVSFLAGVRKEFVAFAPTSRSALGPTQPFSHWVPGSFLRDEAVRA